MKRRISYILFFILAANSLALPLQAADQSQELSKSQFEQFRAKLADNALLKGLKISLGDLHVMWQWGVKKAKGQEIDPALQRKADRAFKRTGKPAVIVAGIVAVIATAVLGVALYRHKKKSAARQSGIGSGMIQPEEAGAQAPTQEKAGQKNVRSERSLEYNLEEMSQQEQQSASTTGVRFAPNTPESKERQGRYVSGINRAFIKFIDPNATPAKLKLRPDITAYTSADVESAIPSDVPPVKKKEDKNVIKAIETAYLNDEISDEAFESFDQDMTALKNSEDYSADKKDAIIEDLLRKLPNNGEALREKLKKFHRGGHYW